MGYCHYWELEQEIGQESFSRIVADVQRIILSLDDMGVRLAGPLGKGLPEIDTAHIAFNGLWDCGHVKKEEIAIPFPMVDAAGTGSSINAVVGSYYGMGIRASSARRRQCWQSSIAGRRTQHLSSQEERCQPKEWLIFTRL